MREYKNSEMFAMLEKNPDLTFVCTNGGKKFVVTASTKENYFVQEAELDGQKYSRYDLPNWLKFFGNVSINSKWQLVRQPVTWQEAIQAWLDGKTIRCVVPQEYSNGTRDIEFVFQCEDFLINNNEEPPYKSYFKYGTWYIEGDSDAVR